MLSPSATYVAGLTKASSRESVGVRSAHAWRPRSGGRARGGGAPGAGHGHRVRAQARPAPRRGRRAAAVGAPLGAGRRPADPVVPPTGAVSSGEKFRAVLEGSAAAVFVIDDGRV